MSDMIRAATDIQNYVNHPDETTRRLAEESLDKNVGTSKQDLELFSQSLGASGSAALPELALIEAKGGHFNDDDGHYSKEEFSAIADNTNNTGLTRLAALSSADNYDGILRSDDALHQAYGFDPLITGPIASGINLWNAATDKVESSEELSTYAALAQASAKSKGLGVGDNFVDQKTSTNIQYDSSLSSQSLIDVITSKDQSAEQRLQAAYALHQKGGNDKFTVTDGDSSYSVSINADSAGNIGLWTNDGSPRVLMRAVVRNGNVVHQGNSSYFGDVWSHKHPDSIFSA